MDQINNRTEGEQATGYSVEQYRAMAAALGIGPSPTSSDVDAGTATDSDPRLMTHAEREARVREVAAAKGVDFREELFRSRAAKRASSDNSLGL